MQTSFNRDGESKWSRVTCDIFEAWEEIAAVVPGASCVITTTHAYVVMNQYQTFRFAIAMPGYESYFPVEGYRNVECPLVDGDDVSCGMEMMMADAVAYHPRHVECRISLVISDSVSEWSKISSRTFDDPLEPTEVIARGVLNSPHIQLWLYHDIDGVAIGAAIVHVHDDHVHVEWIGVVPERRRLGNGADFLIRLQHHYAQSGAIRMSLQAIPGTRRFYEKLGYVAVCSYRSM